MNTSVTFTPTLECGLRSELHRMRCWGGGKGGRALAPRSHAHCDRRLRGALYFGMEEKPRLLQVNVSLFSDMEHLPRSPRTISRQAQASHPSFNFKFADASRIAMITESPSWPIGNPDRGVGNAEPRLIPRTPGP